MGWRAALLLGAAALGGCSVARVYHPASPRAVEEDGVRVEAASVAVGARRGEPIAVGAGVRITAAAPLRVEGVRLAASAAEPCGTGREPSVSYRLDATGTREAPLAGEVGQATVRAGALFRVAPAQLSPAGPAGVDLGFSRDGAPRCLRVPLVAAGEDGWRELSGVFVGYATRGQWTFTSDGASKSGWLPVAIAVGAPLGPGRAALEVSSSLGYAAVVEAPVLRRPTLAAVLSVGYETDDFASGGPRIGLRLLRTVAPTGWTGYREVALAPGWGLDVYVSRWWPLGAGGVEAWVFAAGVSAELQFPHARR